MPRIGRRLMILLALAQAGPALAAADPAQIAKGETLAGLAGCANCHTAKGGTALAGGDGLKTPFGVFYPPNITPDPTQGIGGWDDATFLKALREGRSPEGEPYYPAFPYTSFTHMTDEDLLAIKAWIDSLPPSPQESKPHELSFPYNQRWGLDLWQAAFFKPARFEPDKSKDEAWNRGAYLVQGPGHCAECHTPRNFAGALDTARAWAGGPNPAGEGKIPNISSDPTAGIGKWSEDDLKTALTLGMLPDGDFLGGEMGKVVNNGTSKLPPEDLQAIVTYVKSLPPSH